MSSATSQLSVGLIDRLVAIVGRSNCITDPAQLHTYEFDGLTSMRVAPEVVVLPASTEEVNAIVKLAREANLPIVPRGAGTGLAGGSRPVSGRVPVCLSLIRRVLGG